MSPRSLQKAFTLTEVLMAAGILAIGFMLVATIFPVGLKLTTTATERTIASVVLDEADAKIRIFDPNMNNVPSDRLVYFNSDTSDGYRRLYAKFLNLGYPSAEIEALVVDFVHLYPSADIAGDKKYSWSALLKKTSDDTVQVIIFVSRRTNISLRYPKPQTDLGVPANYGIVGAGNIDWPMPVRVNVTADPSNNDILLINDSDEISYINKGTEIVDDQNGNIYTVLDRRGASGNQIELDRDWIDEGGPNPSMWVIPPAVGAARSPCIMVFVEPIVF